VGDVGGRKKEGCLVMGAETLLGRIACGCGVCPTADNHAHLHGHAEVAAIDKHQGQQKERSNTSGGIYAGWK